jgi:predicted DNA-binding protein
MIERGQKARLRELSARDDLSMATFVREAIDHYLRVAAGPEALQLRHHMLEAVGSLPATDGAADDDNEPRGYW